MRKIEETNKKRKRRKSSGEERRFASKILVNLANEKESSTRWHTILSKVGASNASEAKEKKEHYRGTTAEERNVPEIRVDCMFVGDVNRETSWRSWSEERG